MMVDRDNIIYLHRYHSPCGGLLIGECEGLLCLCDWEVPERRVGIVNRIINGLNAKCVNLSTPFIECAITQLDEYFKGIRCEFDLPTLFVGTDFQRRVWNELQQIPYGKTVSYSQLANIIDSPKAVRAVASACRANAISIIVPCHRIIGRNGNLTGYAGGIPAKLHLLSLESMMPTQPNPMKDQSCQRMFSCEEIPVSCAQAPHESSTHEENFPPDL